MNSKVASGFKHGGFCFTALSAFWIGRKDKRGSGLFPPPSVGEWVRSVTEEELARLCSKDGDAFGICDCNDRSTYYVLPFTRSQGTLCPLLYFTSAIKIKRLEKLKRMLNPCAPWKLVKLAEKLCLSFFPKKKIKTIGEEEKENILQSDKATEMGAGTECLGLLIGVYGFCVNKVRTKCIVLFYILMKYE